MNQMGYRTHRGNVFEHRTIQYILNNPVYKGYLRWTPGKKINRNFNDSASIVAKGDWEPIVSKEIWDAAVARFKSEKRTYYKHKRPETEGIHWLSGMVNAPPAVAAWLSVQNIKAVRFNFSAEDIVMGNAMIPTPFHRTD